MKISDAIRDDVESNVRSKGKMYADWNQAKIISTSDSKIEAKVQGSNYRAYDVTISLENDDILVDCTCPYFESSGTCKHIWATIITAERAGFESSKVTSESFLIENDHDDESEEDEFLLQLESLDLNKLKESLSQGSTGSDRKTGYQNVYEFTKKGSSLPISQPDWKSLFSSPRPQNLSSFSEKRSVNNEQVYYKIDGYNTVGLIDLNVEVITRKLKKTWRTWATIIL